MMEESEKKLLNWLKGIKFDEYFSLFQNAAYDLQTISRMTPEVSLSLFSSFSFCLLFILFSTLSAPRARVR